MKVLLGITGSIAAYKGAELVRRFKTRGWEVKVVMTASAQEFVQPLTFQSLSQEPVYTEMFPEDADWRPDHISLGEWPDVFLIAPCSANVLAKLAHGMADDLLCCTALAMIAPVVIAPAMNDRMWQHPATVANVKLLQARGIEIVDVGSGDLACGYQSQGRLADLALIEERVASMIHY